MCLTVQLSRFLPVLFCFLFSDSLYILSCSSCLVNTFFQLFLRKLKRRRRDLNPRAAQTTYTLSRGASSASWVLLRTPNSYFSIWNYWRFLPFVSENAKIIITKETGLVNRFLFIFSYFFVFIMLPGFTPVLSRCALHIRGFSSGRYRNPYWNPYRCWLSAGEILQAN